jgi:hypothetical protein
MDKLQPFLDAVPLPVLLAAPILGALVFLLVPPRLRLSAALIGLVPYLTIGRLPGLGPAYLLCKATGWAALIAVAVAAMLQPGSVRRPHWIAAVYVAIAAIAPVYVLTTEDNMFAIAVRVQWLLMILAAISVARTIDDGPSLERVMRALQIGYAIALLIPFSDLMLHGRGAFVIGINRFSPYQANANQIGIFIAMGFVLNAYYALRDPNMVLRIVWAGFAAMALGMAMLTKSRSTAVACVFPALPMLVYAMRRPVLAIPIAGVMALVAVYVVSQVSELFTLSRLRTVETGRVQQAAEYVTLSIAERPAFGLLGTSGMNSIVDEEIGAHAHNAYLMTAYMGGFSFLLPLLALAGISMLSAWYVWRQRRLFDVDPLLISMMCFTMIMVYAHGFVNHGIYYPTYTWAFLHILLSILLTTMAAEALRARRAQPAANFTGQAALA